MAKKLILLALFVFLGSGFFFFSKKDKIHADGKECAFCTAKVLDAQTFYQGKLSAALYTHKPTLAGHCLIIPKRHVERFEDLTDEEVLEMSQTIRKVDEAVRTVFGTSSYLLLQKNGKEAFQTVPHVHFHYIPREAGDASSLKFILKMYLVNMRSPIKQTEMKDIVLKLKKAMVN